MIWLRFRSDDLVSSGASTFVQYGALGGFAFAALLFFFKVYMDQRATIKALQDERTQREKEYIAVLSEALRVQSISTNLVRSIGSQNESKS